MTTPSTAPADKPSSISKIFQTERIVTVLTFLGIWTFLLQYFQPELLFSNTTTTGGDTCSHNLLAHYLRNSLLPKGQLIGWFPYNFAGLPLFQFYFPLPYFAIAVLSYIIPFNIAFKLITVFGIFFLPVACWISMRAMKLRFPIPLIAASVCLLFLFKESGIAAGGTIKSALAGQFAYNLSVSFMILSLGFVYKGIEENTYVIPAGLMIAGIVFSHAFALIPLMIACTFFLYDDIRWRRVRNTIHLGKVFGLGFFLSGIWSIPYLFKHPWGMIVYEFAGLSSSFAFLKLPIFWVPLSIAAAGIALSLILKQPVRQQLFVLFWFAGIVLFSLIARSSLLVSRFTNVMCLFALLGGVSALVSVQNRLKATWLLPIIVALSIFAFIKYDSKEIASWAKWNYEGLEKKGAYPQYRDINAFFAQTNVEGRINVEYFDYNAMGSPRTFELSPMFHGKPVMEGLLFESSITYPFFFYMQHEVSEKCWWPGFPIRMPKQNLANGIQDFRLFNVHYFVAKSPITKGLADAQPGLVKVKDVGDMRIYRVEPHSQYVEALHHEPILVKTDNWRPYSYTWMGADRRDVILAFTDPKDMESDRYFATVFDGRKGLKKKQGVEAVEDDAMNQILSLGRDYPSSDCPIIEQITNDRIIFTTTCVGRPHLIKMSYFPNWKVKGAKRIYQASPTLMLVIPESPTVEIYYGYLPEDMIGIASTLLSLFGVLLFTLFPHTGPVSRVYRRITEAEDRIHLTVDAIQTFFQHRRRQAVIALAVLLIAAGSVGLIVGYISRKKACEQFCAHHPSALNEAYDSSPEKLLKVLDVAEMGFKAKKNNTEHHFQCEGALCDESRENFVYVNSGAVSFNLTGEKGKEHILTIVTQDNVNCRSNSVFADNTLLGKMIGKGLQTKERRFHFRVPAERMADGQIRVRIVKDKDECYGFDIFKAELSKIICECDHES